MVIRAAFRLGDLLPWLREQAGREGRTMTAIVKDALDMYREERDDQPPGSLGR